MAASDQFYRNQKALDVVFGVSCVLMLGSIVWMFAQDYYRPFKTEQRAFRDVEVAMNQLLAVEALPDLAEIEEAEDDLAKAVKARQDKDKEVRELQKEIDDLRPQRELAEARFQDIKAELDSRVSFYDIEVERHGPQTAYAQSLKNEIKDLQEKLVVVQAERDNVVGDLMQLQRQRDQIEEPVTKAVTRLNKLYEKLDAFVTTSHKKDWTIYDEIRAMPVLDAFASPIKIHQFTINDVPIDYNFAHVTRFDRCMTCHQGIDRPTYTKENLKTLRIPEEYDKKGLQKLNTLQTKLAMARQILEKRKKALADLPEDAAKLPDPNKLVLTMLNKDYLTDARINEFCAHPRLDLFVGADSKHPAEKFGCTSCHAGQGSGTEFSLASHTPNSYPQQKQWTKEHGWVEVHHWDFPMLPMRFVESSCVKCHHEITDLVTIDNRPEAPKLLRGFNLVKDLGCFGCHEITGIKNGRQVGPDLRLEPTPPVHKLPPEDREKLLADKENPPGTLSKVGPSLYRLAEKTNKNWTAKWLASPSSFRPDTKMPHFYGLSNNHPDVLPEEMKEFPDAEMQAITEYLFQSSKEYLKNVEKFQQEGEMERKKDEYLFKALTTQLNLPDVLKAATSLGVYFELKKLPAEKRAEEMKKRLELETDPGKKRKLENALEMVNFVLTLTQDADLTDEEVTQLEKTPREFLQLVRNRIAWREAPAPIKSLIEDYDPDPISGRKLFSERGCLACHHHEGTMQTDEKNKVPALPSHADFGPDLSQVREKLVGSNKDGLKGATAWLANWIKDPQAHNPRTTMPRVPMTDKEILDVTAWLLEQKADKSVGTDWDDIQVKTPKDQVFYNLADVYLTRLLPQRDMDALHEMQGKPGRLMLDSPAITDLPADEQALVKDYTFEKVKLYVGKKAVGRLGCFACHDIPGFDDAKSIGVNLNDWGKKNPERLAFEDIASYVKDHYYLVDHMTAKEGPGAGQAHPVKEGAGPHGKPKNPYEKFFFDSLKHHERIGYLHQKLIEPRSYDHNRLRTWDDLARMPKFKFARPIKKAGETDEQYRDRAWKEEAEAREAVMTFILGLVAEPIPLQSINQPSGDRLDEIKGRQVLEKYNCAGCHQVYPGTYEFQRDDLFRETLLAALEKQTAQRVKDFDFLDHIAWAGKAPKPAQEIVKAFGLPQFGTDGRIAGLANNELALQLMFALRFSDMKGIFHDLRGGEQTLLPLDKMMYPPPAEFIKLAEIQQEWEQLEDAGLVEEAELLEKRFKESYRDFEEKYGAFGGRFAALLPYYLAEGAQIGTTDRDGNPFSKEVYGGLDTTTYKIVPKNLALAASPPPLVGQGGKTQPDWLYQFLLNPQRIRKLTVLQMPHFNLTEEEAKALVRYFGAVERLTNPKFEVTSAFANIPQQTSQLSDPYWKKKTKEYVQRLKNSKIDDKKNYYEQRLEELKPVWKKIEEQSREELSRAEKQLESIEGELKDQDKDKADPILKEAERVWKDEVKRLKDVVKQTDTKVLHQKWDEEEAYITDAFRLLGNKDLCIKCHQIGNVQPAGKESDGHGPPLGLSPKRLKPNWVTHWVANPPRLLHYTPMPQYFSHDAKTFQHLFVGDSKQQVQALTDVLMIYDRAIDMPVNRHWTLLPVAPAKKD